jgi:hypothetical protein
MLYFGGGWIQPRRSTWAPGRRLPTIARRIASKLQITRNRLDLPPPNEERPASLERVGAKLTGSNDGDRQMVKVLTAVLIDGYRRSRRPVRKR